VERYSRTELLPSIRLVLVPKAEAAGIKVTGEVEDLVGEDAEGTRVFLNIRR
jgi:hypothetical protein